MKQNSLNSKINFYPLEFRAIAALGGIFSLRMLGLFMILPVFALYAKQLNEVSHTISPTEIGLALGIYGLTQALLQVPFGYLSDRLGRKPMIIIGLLLFCFGSVVAAMSNSIAGIIIGRSIQGSGAVGSVIMALVADITREEVRLRAMALIGISIGASFGLAFILGPLLSAKWGVPGIFWLTAAFALVGIAVLIYCVPSPVKSSLPLSSVQSFSPTSPLDFPSSKIYNLYFGVLVLHASLPALFLKIPDYIQDLQFSAAQTWQFYLPVFLLAVLFTVPMIFILEKQKKLKHSLLFLVSLLLIAEILLANLHHSTVQLATSLCLFFMAFNCLEASLPASISKAAPVNQKGMVLGFFSSLQFLGLFLGGLCGGILETWGGDVAVFSFCVILALSWLVWSLMLSD